LVSSVNQRRQSTSNLGSASVEFLHCAKKRIFGLLSWRFPPGSEDTANVVVAPLFRFGRGLQPPPLSSALRFVRVALSFFPLHKAVRQSVGRALPPIRDGLSPIAPFAPPRLSRLESALRLWE
jgi:hypothetical protein